jgi:hypothetical protein
MTANDGVLKTCSVCGFPKLVSEFYRNGAYVRTICRGCLVEKARPGRVRRQQAGGYVNLVCEKCGNPFQRLRSWHEENQRRGNIKSYCGPKCFPRNPKKADALSPFIAVISRLRDRCKRRGLPLTVTADALKTLWEAQGGICPFTGWVMLLFPGGHAVRGASQPNQASLDRINQEAGYVPGNVRFISLIANYARNEWSDEEVLRFCKSTAAYRKEMVL